MNSTFRRLAWVFTSLMTVTLVAQQTRPSISNSDVLKMVAAQVPDEAIILAIQGGRPNFDLSVDQIIALKQAGVSGEVIIAMQRAAAGDSPTGGTNATRDRSRFTPTGNEQVDSSRSRQQELLALQPGDSITEMDGRSVTYRQQILDIAYKHEAGASIPIRLLRDGAEVRTRATAAEIIRFETPEESISYCVSRRDRMKGNHGVLDISPEHIEFSSFDLKGHSNVPTDHYIWDQKDIAVHLISAFAENLAKCNPNHPEEACWKTFQYPIEIVSKKDREFFQPCRGGGYVQMADVDAIVNALQQAWAGQSIEIQESSNGPLQRDIVSEPTDAQLQSAIQRGRREPGRVHGLVLEDTGAGVMQGLATLAASQGQLKPGTQVSASGFSVTVYTPLAWVADQASRAAGRAFTLSDVTPEMRRPILRVFARPSTPPSVGVNLGLDVSSVTGVLVMDIARKKVLSADRSVPIQSGALAGMLSEFSLDELATLRHGYKGFRVVVKGVGGNEKDFEVKPKHFNELP